MNRINNTQGIILIITSIAAFIMPFMGSAINVALPNIGQQFNLNAMELSWVASVYLLSTAIFMLPFGKWSDSFGRKKLFATGMAITFCTSLFIPYSTEGWFLILLRGIQGIGGAMIFSTSVAILISVFPSHLRGQIIGINVASVYLGLSLGPFVGGVLTQWFGWQSIFWLITSMSAIALLLTLLFFKEQFQKPNKKPYHFIDALLYCFALALIIYGFSRSTELLGIVMICSGISFMIIFIILSGKRTNALLDVGLFKYNRVFAFSNIAALIHYSATFAISFIMSLFLQYQQNATPSQAGIVLVSMPVMMTIFSPLAGKLSDQWEPRYIASSGMFLTLLALLALITITSSQSTITIAIILSVAGIGFALFSSPNTNAVMSSVKPPQYGTASSVLGTMRSIGQAMSMGIVMLIISFTIGLHPISQATSQQFMSTQKITFIVFAVLCAIGTIISLFRSNIHTSHEINQ